MYAGRIELMWYIVSYQYCSLQVSGDRQTCDSSRSNRAQRTRSYLQYEDVLHPLLPYPVYSCADLVATSSSTVLSCHSVLFDCPYPYDDDDDDHLSCWSCRRVWRF